MRRLTTCIVAMSMTNAAVAAESGERSAESGQARDVMNITWSGASGCRPTSDIIDGLRRLLGNVSQSSAAQPLEVAADVHELPEGWSLELSAIGPLGPMRRGLIAPSCDELAQAASVVLSLWFHPDNHLELFPESTPRSPAEPNGPKAAEAHVDDERRVEAHSAVTSASMSRVLLTRRSWRSRAGRRLHLQASMGPTTFSGALPASGWGLTGHLGVSFDDWRLDAIGLWLSSQQIWAKAPVLVGGEFGLWASGLRAARAVPLMHSLNVLPGIWSLVGQLSGRSLGTVVESTPSTGSWGAAGVGVDMELRLGRSRLVIGGGCGLPFGRPRFLVGSDALYRIPWVTWFGQFLIGTSFP